MFSIGTVFLFANRAFNFSTAVNGLASSATSLFNSSETRSLVASSSDNESLNDSDVDIDSESLALKNSLYFDKISGFSEACAFCSNSRLCSSCLAIRACCNFFKFATLSLSSSRDDVLILSLLIFTLLNLLKIN